MRVLANAPGLLPPMAKPSESAPALSRTRSPSPHAEGMAESLEAFEAFEAFDDRMRRSLAERALGPVQAKPAIDAGYGDLIAAARAPLPRTPPRGRVSGTDAPVQRYTTDAGGFMRSASDAVALQSQTQNLWATSESIAASNTALAAAGKGSALRLTAGEEQGNFKKVGVEWKASKLGGKAAVGATKHTNLDTARKEDPLLLWADCSKASAEVSGSSSGNRSDDLVVMNEQGSKGGAKPGQTMKGLQAKENESSAAKFASAVYLELLDQFIAANKDANYMVDKYHYKTVTGSQRRTPLKIGSVTYASADKVKQAGFAADVPLAPGPRARALYDKLGANGREAFDAYAGINRHAAPDVGESYSMATEFSMPGSAAVRDDGGNLMDRWVYHYAGVVMADGSDRVALENYSVSDDKVVNTGWHFEMYGTPTQGNDAQGQTFHDKHLASGTHGTKATSLRIGSKK